MARSFVAILAFLATSEVGRHNIVKYKPYRELLGIEANAVSLTVPDVIRRTGHPASEMAVEIYRLNGKIIVSWIVNSDLVRGGGIKYTLTPDGEHILNSRREE